jgi:hypothetical protein
MDHRAGRDSRVLDFRGLRDRRVFKESRVHRGFRECSDFRETRDSRASKESRVHRAFRDGKE